MALIVLDVKLPTVLGGQQNGRLNAGLLTSVPDPTGGPTIRLLAVAARSHAALMAAALQAGHRLKATGGADGYRSYDTQVTVFLARYTKTPTDNGSRVWNGTRYWLKEGMAPAAVPGTSNHGWAIAKDFASETDGDAQPEAITAGAVKWLNENAPRFGWSFELQLEPWHLRHVTGDNVTPAVLAYEQGDDMATAAEIADAVWAKGVSSPSLDKPLTPTSDWLKGGEAARQALGVVGGEPTIAARLTRLEQGQVAILAAIAKLGAASGGAHDHDVELTLSAQTLKGTTGPAKPTDG